MISLIDVKKSFSGRVALHGLNLEVQPGEIFGLLGHNGAGKSTAIGMMLGQVWPTSGEVKVCGHDVTTDRARALEKVGAIFEAPAFYDYLSGRKNLEILSQYSAPTPAKRIDEVLNWVGLTGRQGSKVRTYSHGMRARLAIAQALLPRPELVIFDEPGSGLDPEGIAEMRQTILRLHREMGLTILLSSHLLSEVEQLCSRIAVLNQGRKVFDGPISDAIGAPGRLMLKTPDFSKAAAVLLERGIITSSSEEKYIALRDGQTAADAVRVLVNANIPVDGIWEREQTLEDFYMELIKDRSNSN
ncbi:MAG TPA: ABC transporter ATP-binding protein [Verrucomicrobiae bacterium]|jgi:ABC-2 type transport system ATP-binding protein|nr:ABC transporter ATP-binding protein [Verrucomicrobiae bacterium]